MRAKGELLWLTANQIDCVVTGVKPQGVFCECGPLTVFVSKLVSGKSGRISPMAYQSSIFQKA